MKCLDYFSIKQKLAFLLLFLVSAVSYLTLSAINQTQQYNKKNIEIEVAQKQMLIFEKFVNSVFFARQISVITNKSVDNIEIKKNQFLFEKNLKAMQSGGKVYQHLDMQDSINIDPISAPHLQVTLQESQQIWIELIETSQKLPLQSLTMEDLSIAHHLAELLQQKLTTIVDTLKQKNIQEAQNDLIILQLSWLFIVLIGSLFFWLIAKNITQPLDKIAKVASRIRQGDLQSYPTDNAHKDELGTLIYEADEMRLSLSKLMQKIQQHNKQIIHSSAHLQSLFKKESTQHKSQQNQNAELKARVNYLQECNNQFFHKLAQMQGLILTEQQIIDGFLQTSQESLMTLNDIDQCNRVNKEKIVHVQQSTEQLCTLLLFLEEITNKTQALAKKATIDAVRSGKESEQFTLVASQVTNFAKKTAFTIEQISGQLTQLQVQVDLLPNQFEQSETSVPILHKQLVESSQSLQLLSAQVIQQQDNCNDLTKQNNQQAMQIENLHEALDMALQLINESNGQTDENLLFIKDLYKVSTQLDSLSDEFKVDPKQRRARKGNDKRQYPRIKNQLKVSLQQADIHIQGLTEDISLSGLQIKSLQSAQFKHTTPVSFSINLPCDNPEEEIKEVSLLGDIIYSEQQQDTFIYRARFHPLSEKDKAKVEQIFEYFNKKSEFKS